MNEYRKQLITLAKQANEALQNYLKLSNEDQAKYEQEINYERDKIIITTEPYKTEAYIYLLYDEAAISKTCYVGVADNIEERLNEHNKDWNTLSNRNHKKCWIKSLKNRNTLASILIIDTIPTGEKWQIWESFCIAYYKYIGVGLCNGTLGGDGNPGYKHTEEAIEKMSKAKLGKKQAEETKLKKMRQDILEDMEYIKELYLAEYSLNEISQTYNASVETITKHLKRVGIEIREETHTERSKQKIKDANIGKTQSTETIEKRASQLRGKERPPETRNKISTTRKELIASGEIQMPTNKASRKDAGKYRDDVNDAYLLELHKQGKSLREIGRIVNMEHHSVKARLEGMGVGFSIKEQPKEVDDELIIRLYVNENKTFNQIAKEIGKDGKYIKKVLVNNNVKLRPSNYKKQVSIDMDKMMELYNKGLTYTDIARVFDTTGTTIKSYLKKQGLVG
jgi:predicted transcriptional regulator with HTH domain